MEKDDKESTVSDCEICYQNISDDEEHSDKSSHTSTKPSSNKQLVIWFRYFCKIKAVMLLRKDKLLKIGSVEDVPLWEVWKLSNSVVDLLIDTDYLNTYSMSY